MEDTKFEGPGKGKIGLIRFILSQKEGQQFLAACIFVIITLAGVIGILGGVIVKQAAKIDELHVKNYEIKAQSDDQQIEYWKHKNDNEMRLKQQVDSMKAALEIYQLKKQMR